MGKKDLVNHIHEANLISSKETIGILLDMISEYYVDRLREKGKVSIQGVGKLQIVQRPPKICWNPSTKSTMELPQREDIKVSLSKTLKEKVLSSSPET